MTGRLLAALHRLAWRNRGTVRSATAVVDGAYLLRRVVRGAPRTRLASPASGAVAGLERYARYVSEFGHVGGWFTEGAIATWDALLEFQRSSSAVGDLLEIGVLKGKSAILLALHARSDEAVVLVDPALRREAIDGVERVHPNNNILLRARSDEIRDRPELVARRARFRWIHIDGEHTGRAVLNDMALASELLAPSGIMCLDDFFAPSYPQITRATFDFLSQAPEFQLFLLGYRKGFICHAAMVQTYLRFVRDELVSAYRQRRFDDFTICKTTDPDDMNCFGVVERRGTLDWKGPDHDPASIQI